MSSLRNLALHRRGSITTIRRELILAAGPVNSKPLEQLTISQSLLQQSYDRDKVKILESTPELVWRAATTQDRLNGAKQ